MLNLAIECYLNEKEGWKTIRISEKNRLADVLRMVQSINPDIVIVNQGDRTGSDQLPLRLIQCKPALRVITIRLENNLAEVFSKQEIMVRQMSDLDLAIDY